MLCTRSPVYSPCGFLPRLACVRHAASVRSEPGSNSPIVFYWSLSGFDFYSFSRPAKGQLLLLKVTASTASSHATTSTTSCSSVFKDPDHALLASKDGPAADSASASPALPSLLSAVAPALLCGGRCSYRSRRQLVKLLFSALRFLASDCSLPLPASLRRGGRLVTPAPFSTSRAQAIFFSEHCFLLRASDGRFFARELLRGRALCTAAVRSRQVGGGDLFHPL